MNNQQTARIIIIDLPAFRDISEEEMKEIFGAGRKNSVSLGLESLERRELMAGSLSATFTSGILNINGTDDADKIVVRSRWEDSTIKIEGINIKDIKGNDIEPLTKEVKSINITAQAGDDLIWVNSNFNFPITTDGGMGSDTVISNSSNLNNKESPLGDINAKDYLVSGSIATVYERYNSNGTDFGPAISNASVHRKGGSVQHFENFDIWVNGNDVQVYQSDIQNLATYKFDGDYLNFISDKEISYDKTDFFNSQNIYDKSPTLVVITHGAKGFIIDDSGYGFEAYQRTLASNTARQFNISGSQVHVMQITWASNTLNIDGSKDVANHINKFLDKNRGNDVPIDVMLIGHSRGAIFNFEAAKHLDNDKIDTLQMVMLDPTAALSLGDIYPTNTLKNVNQTVVYDDGVNFLGVKGLGLIDGGIVDGERISGAEYRKVDLGFGTPGSLQTHVKVATFYANGDNSKLNFQDDTSWLIKQKSINKYNYFEDSSGSEEFKATGDKYGQIFFHTSFDGKNATVNAGIGVASMGVSVGVDGVSVGLNSLIGGANASIGQDKVNVGVNTAIAGANGSVGLNGASVNINIGGLKTEVDIKTPQFVVNEVNNVVDKLKTTAEKITVENAKAAFEDAGNNVITSVNNFIKDPAAATGGFINDIFGNRKPHAYTPPEPPSIIEVAAYVKVSIDKAIADVNQIIDAKAAAEKAAAKAAADVKAAADNVAADLKAAADKAAADLKAAADKITAANAKAAADKAAADVKAAADKAAADLKAAADKITAANAKAAADRAAAALKAAADKAAADVKAAADKITAANAKAAADRAAAALKAAVNNAGKGISKAFKKFSDIRLKENIVKTSEISGINIYTYNYLGDSVLQRGVMAQELLGTNFADAVEMQDNGFYAVDYSLLPELQ